MGIAVPASSHTDVSDEQIEVLAHLVSKVMSEQKKFFSKKSFDTFLEKDGGAERLVSNFVRDIQGYFENVENTIVRFVPTKNPNYSAKDLIHKRQFPRDFVDVNSIVASVTLKKLPEEIKIFLFKMEEKELYSQRDVELEYQRRGLRPAHLFEEAVFQDSHGFSVFDKRGKPDVHSFWEKGKIFCRSTYHTSCGKGQYDEEESGFFFRVIEDKKSIQYKKGSWFIGVPL